MKSHFNTDKCSGYAIIDGVCIYWHEGRDTDEGLGHIWPIPDTKDEAIAQFHRVQAIMTQAYETGDYEEMTKAELARVKRKLNGLTYEVWNQGTTVVIVNKDAIPQLDEMKKHGLK